MKAKPSDFAKSSGTVRQMLNIPTLKVSAKASPPATEKRGADVAYGIDTLDKLVNVFDERERTLKSRKGL